MDCVCSAAAEKAEVAEENLSARLPLANPNASQLLNAGLLGRKLLQSETLFDCTLIHIIHI